jgi:hypothetical protein
VLRGLSDAIGAFAPTLLYDRVEALLASPGGDERDLAAGEGQARQPTRVTACCVNDDGFLHANPIYAERVHGSRFAAAN